MKRNFKRLALALIISSSCFTATVIWFESGKSTAEAGRHAPMARLNDASNDVQRKPLKRVIWESVGKNDDLFPGEAIRTSENAEAKIQLVKSGAVIHLEANSLVVLEENENGMSLDFLQGNMFVTSNSGGTEGLTLKTGAGEIKLNSADMSLSRDSDGKVDMAVFKGQAELQQGSQKLALGKDKSASFTEKGLSLDKNRMQILYPVTGEDVLLNLSRGESLSVLFKPLSPSYKVSVEWGSSRANLKPVGESAAGEGGKIQVAGKSGKWFVRLRAKSINAGEEELASNIIPVVIDPKSPPSLVEPLGDGPVAKNSGNGAVQFRWLNRHRLESQILEIATDASFKKIKVKQSLAADTASFENVLADGVYYWRVTGFLKIKNKIEPLSSKTARFAQESKWELKPPVPIWPISDSRIPYPEAIKNGVVFKWESQTGVKNHQIIVQKKTGDFKTLVEQTVPADTFKLGELAPGTYQWKISSLDAKGGAPKSTSFIPFTIEEIPKIDWVEAPAIYEYPTPTPSLRVEWKSGPAATASYRFRFENLDLVGKPISQDTKQTVFDAPVPADGSYVVTVEALSAQEHVIAQSSPTTIRVQRRPLLPAPQWAQNSPEVFKADAKGNLNFAWQEVEGARNYLMVLESEDGKVVEKKEISRTTASFSRLKPGQYKVRLKSVDSLRRPGDESRSKNLVVPSISDIQAPKIKNMKVK